MDETTNRIMLIIQDNGKPFPAGLLVMTTFKIKNRYDYIRDKYYTYNDFTIATLFIKKEKVQSRKENNNTNSLFFDRSIYFFTINDVVIFLLR